MGQQVSGREKKNLKDTQRKGWIIKPHFYPIPSIFFACHSHSLVSSLFFISFSFPFRFPCDSSFCHYFILFLEPELREPASSSLSSPFIHFLSFPFLSSPPHHHYHSFSILIIHSIRITSIMIAISSTWITAAFLSHLCPPFAFICKERNEYWRVAVTLWAQHAKENLRLAKKVSLLKLIVIQIWGFLW